MRDLSRREALVGLGGASFLALWPNGLALAASSSLAAGAVATADEPSALIGKSILEAGGNAVDAAVAIGFALAVSYPEAGNLGGGGFMTIVMQGKPYFLDYREMAPALARQDMYLDEKGDLVASRSLIGNQASATPGTVMGLAEAHRRFGRLAWKDVLAPAITLAKEGFKPPPQMIKIYQEAATELGPSTNLVSYFGTLAKDTTFVQPELAETLRLLAKHGPDAFYNGPIGDQIVAQMQRGSPKGLISKTDLAAYRCVWRKPLVGTWRGFDVITAPPPSSGGIALLQLLTMKEVRSDLFANVAHNSTQYIHLMAELEKRAYADRAAYLGDPDFVSVPTERLLAKAYLTQRAQSIQSDRPSHTPSVQAGLEKPQTTHYSVIDQQGNAVSNTYTLNGWYGSGVVVEGAGFLLNNEMDDFSAKPGLANQYGVTGGDANAIAPRKRPLSSMTPTILMRNGMPVLALGSPGGSRIITTVFQVMINALEFQMPLKKAIDAPRFHHQLLPENTIFTEPYAPMAADQQVELEKLGYRIEPQSYNGDVAAIQIVDRQPIIAPDPRARGHALVVPA
jgi:gamma-glutamyltranspeptidase/glutathione hydrolase